ncbi:MAG: helix-turn-helix transcriptional regulator [Aerococcus sp.]|nr:helix-turn-helix transcriptional regulator [Aerococcus sp.]
MNTKIVYMYRHSFAKTQAEAAKLMGLSLSAYRSRETGKTEFDRSEMLKFTSLVQKEKPDITVNDIFFSD